MVDIKTYMSGLSIEITRKCNMNCIFCSRGDSQNLTISKSIIDKTLDEMKGVYINSLRISGGEPLLEPSLITYLFEKIIQKRIYINDVIIFTNGINTNLEVCSCIVTFIDYLIQIESEIKDIIKWSNKVISKTYHGISNKKISIIVSDVNREDYINQQNKTIDFFKQHITNEKFAIIKQSDTFNDINCLILDGNAKKNCHKLLGKSVDYKNIRMIDNNYFFISNYRDINCPSFMREIEFILKTLSVSANGNVFAGCMSSYDSVDSAPMFNITDCSCDFLQRVKDFCWQYPISEDVAKLRNKYLAIKFCQENGIKVTYSDDVKKKQYYLNKIDFAELNILYSISQRHKKIATIIHQDLPSRDFVIIDSLSILVLAKELIKMEIPKEHIQSYLKTCSSFNDDFVDSISTQQCDKMIKRIKKLYYIH